MTRAELKYCATALALWILTGSVSAAGKPQSQVWLTRPWEIRYIIFVSDELSCTAGARYATNENKKLLFDGVRKPYFDAEEFFERTNRFTVPKKLDLSTVVIRFSSNGGVIDGLKGGLKFSAKRNVLDEVVLVPPTKMVLPYHLATWSQGIPGELGFSPAVCGMDDWDRYLSDWDLDHPSGNFGCREWTYQLYNRDRPYIDVTTYRPEGNFIGEFVGWARFEDPPKPVIGQHGKTWLCLHECPAGEKPGPIKDIRAWTARHGFDMPEPPAKQPQFPNKDYLDDIREEFED